MQVRSAFRRFFQEATAHQKHSILWRLQQFYEAASRSQWFAYHEIIGNSLLFGVALCSGHSLVERSGPPERP